MYFQCDPGEDASSWSDDRIWSELQARLAGPDGFELNEGPVIERTVLPFRSFVQTPMRSGRLLLAGDAAHTVPPTGAKGLNLALADTRVLAEVIERAIGTGDLDALDDYTDRALQRVWKAQHFSYWMTTMLHRAPGEQEHRDFDELRQLGELTGLVSSEAGATYLAEGYTGWRDGARVRPGDGLELQDAHRRGDAATSRCRTPPADGPWRRSRGGTTRRTAPPGCATPRRISSRPTPRGSSCGRRCSAHATSASSSRT